MHDYHYTFPVELVNFIAISGRMRKKMCCWYLFADDHASVGVGWCASLIVICIRRGRGLRPMNGKVDTSKMRGGKERTGRMNEMNERDRSREEDRFKYLS